MATEVETHTGVCPTHGTVEATREIPKIGWPYIINVVRRYLARRRPYHCPTCGADVTAG